MSKRIPTWVDPFIVLIGLAISIVVGVVMVRSGEDTVRSLTVSMLSATIALIIEVVVRVMRTEGAIREVTKVSQILSERHIGEYVREMAVSYEAIEQCEFDHYHTIADDSLAECMTRLREIASGSVVVRAKTPQAYVVRGIQEARRDTKVIHIGFMDFWSTDLGRQYFALNKAAVRRGVGMTRVFALTPEEVRDSLQMLKAQQEAGIRVLVVKPSRVTDDFVIFDERILVEFQVGEYRHYSRERIILDPTQVRKRLREFENLVRYSKTIGEIASDT